MLVLGFTHSHCHDRDVPRVSLCGKMCYKGGLGIHMLQADFACGMSHRIDCWATFQGLGEHAAIPVGSPLGLDPNHLGQGCSAMTAAPHKTQTHGSVLSWT